jgi:hypothetical protein
MVQNCGTLSTLGENDAVSSDVGSGVGLTVAPSPPT